MKKLLLKSSLGFALLFTATVVNAGSDAAFPKDWASWPVQHSSAIPGSSTPTPTNIPPIVQETIKTYNWVQDGKGSKYNVRVNPAQMSGYKAHNGKFQDGPTAVLELTDIKVLLVRTGLWRLQLRRQGDLWSAPITLAQEMPSLPYRLWRGVRQRGLFQQIEGFNISLKRR